MIGVKIREDSRFINDDFTVTNIVVERVRKFRMDKKLASQTSDVETDVDGLKVFDWNPYEDLGFMEREELRAIRLQMDYLKPELTLLDEDVRSTIVVFGSTRLTDTCDTPAMQSGAAPLCQKQFGHYYKEARRFSSLVSQKYRGDGPNDHVVVTGGGPGIMEAANRGAYDVGARSIGLNISLPNEQKANPYITPELNFHFRYFGLRKLHFVMRAKALVAFPGGFGTLDEVFDVLTLLQTKKIDPIPVILFGGDYWNRVIDFDFLAKVGFINPEDLELFTIVETAEEALEYICGHKTLVCPESNKT